MQEPRRQNQFLGSLGKRKGLAAAPSANPSSSLVAGVRFGLWTRPLKFDFLVTY